MTTRSFTMAAHVDAVDPTVQRLKEETQTALSEARRVGFEIALTEALNNIVLHAMRGRPAPPVTITLTLGTGSARVDIADRGEPAPADLFRFGPGLEDVDDMAETGRGVALIRACADSVDYRSTEGVNHLRLVFTDIDEPDAGNGTP